MILILKISFGSAIGCVWPKLQGNKLMFRIEQGLLRLLRTKPHRKHQSVVRNSWYCTHLFNSVLSITFLPFNQVAVESRSHLFSFRTQFRASLLEDPFTRMSHIFFSFLSQTTERLFDCHHTSTFLLFFPSHLHFSVCVRMQHCPS